MVSPLHATTAANEGLSVILINALQVATMSKGKGEQDRHRKDWNFDFTEIGQKRSAFAMNQRHGAMRCLTVPYRSRGAKSEDSSPPGYTSTPVRPDVSFLVAVLIMMKVFPFPTLIGLC